MQKLIAFICLVAFTGQTFNQGWYYISYLIQKQQYMDRCVNKARPQMHCDGKCLLMKKIQEQEKKEQAGIPEMKFAGKTEVISERSSFHCIPPFNSLQQTHHCPATCGAPIDQPASIFHPPLAA